MHGQKSLAGTIPASGDRVGIARHVLN